MFHFIVFLDNFLLYILNNMWYIVCVCERELVNMKTNIFAEDNVLYICVFTLPSVNTVCIYILLAFAGWYFINIATCLMQILHNYFYPFLYPFCFFVSLRRNTFPKSIQLPQNNFHRDLDSSPIWDSFIPFFLLRSKPTEKQTCKLMLPQIRRSSLLSLVNVIKSYVKIIFCLWLNSLWKNLLRVSTSRS